ncbi:SDR family oxidoreductase [Nocardioides immobilis]|uniref:SDR family oxidoreductase n=1 Tax=Nocardioides immobilis TaxID=2049295 RepID=A0A417Y7I7_9ACTN|nr:SDR family oxidoreductase [Nocardioides immobilis]RHW28424.1 SDR family oxidoreductase [Nocardioides immobilis]
MPSPAPSTPGPIIVTGGTGGLGSAICRRLAGDGARIAFTYKARTETAAALVDELTDLGASARADAVDLQDAVVTQRYIDGVTADWGGVGTVIHAAGPYIPMVHLSKVPPAQFKEALDAEVVGFFNVISGSLPALRESAGSVVAVTTAATSRYPVRDGLSAGPKAAIESLVRGFAAEEGRFGVRLNCVGPGMLTDGMAERLISTGELDERALAMARSNIPLRRFGTADDIAEAVAFLASDRAKFISGQKIDVDGGYGV